MPGKPRSKPVTDAQILESYNTIRSAYKVAKVLGIGDTTVYRTLVKHNVSRSGLDDYRKSITKFQGQEQQIRDWYDAGDTLDQIRHKLGEAASDFSIKHAIRRAGGSFRVNLAPTIKDGELDQIRKLHDGGMGQIGISLALNRSQSFVSRAMRRNGIFSHKPTGETHGNWKGGRLVTTNGYVQVIINDDDPMAAMRNNSGYVMEHRLVKARELGRLLGPTETVHHIDGNKSNNSPENLQLRHGNHGRNVVPCCMDCGSRNIGTAVLD